EVKARVQRLVDNPRRINGGCWPTEHHRAQAKRRDANTSAAEEAVHGDFRFGISDYRLRANGLNAPPPHPPPARHSVTHCCWTRYRFFSVRMKSESSPTAYDASARSLNPASAILVNRLPGRMTRAGPSSL